MSLVQEQFLCDVFRKDNALTCAFLYPRFAKEAVLQTAILGIVIFIHVSKDRLKWYLHIYIFFIY